MEINKGRAIVNRLLGNTENDVDDDDIQIHQANVKIGLKCPISLQRIKLPTKGETCKHADVGFIYLLLLCTTTKLHFCLYTYILI